MKYEKFRTKGWDANNSNFMNLEVTKTAEINLFQINQKIISPLPAPFQLCLHWLKI